uniref:Retrovirus-related Pol polyprotein from transposon TNT 1-94 n=1 Tax=Tanacetum cinerariifolium TaxID=118510 RepID=A0A699HG60_TANCI|nr:retrovirus-related Pol polyprotein from transposon TNT 1-94 [Tanacetum cinerariifolium]
MILNSYKNVVSGFAARLTDADVAYISCNDKIIRSRSLNISAMALNVNMKVKTPLDDYGHKTHTPSTTARVFAKNIQASGGATACIDVGMAPQPMLQMAKTAEGDVKLESQWTPDESRVFVQGQRLKSIIMSCLPDDVMKSVISCVSAKETWTDLVYSFEGPLDTKENRIMDLKLEYQTFRTTSTESLSQTYTRYKTLLNKLANDGVNLSKHEINVGFVNSLPEKWLTFSQGLRNANHTQTHDLAGIYERFVYEDNLIQRRMKAKLALLEASFLSPQNPKTFQPKNKYLVSEIFDWDEKEVSEDEEVTQVKVLMALADDELSVGKSHVRNEQIKEEKRINEKWLTSSKKVSQCISEQIPHQKKKVLGGELLTESLSKININENAFIPASMRIPYSTFSPKKPSGSFSKLRDDAIDLSTPLSKKENRLRILYCMICKREDHRTSNHEMYIASLRSENYKAQPYQYASSSKQILKANAKPFPPCTHYGFNDHRPDDYRNYPECGICGSYDHSTSGHNRVIHIRGGVLVESCQSNESSIRVKCNTCRSTIHSTSNYNEFDHFKRGEKAQAAKAMEPTKKWHVKKGSTIELHSNSPLGSVCIFFIWTCLDPKSQAPEMIMTFVRMVENQNDVKVK